MSQFTHGTIDPYTKDGTQLVADIASEESAQNTNHKAASRPSYAVAGMIWVKTVSAVADEIYYYDGANDILLGTVDPTNNTWANTGSAIFTSLEAATAKFTSGAGAGKILTSDASGNGTWQNAPTGTVPNSGTSTTNMLVGDGAGGYTLTEINNAIARNINPKSFSQAVSLTAATSGSNGIQNANNANLNYSTYDFSVGIECSVPDWTPSADVVLRRKHDGANGWILSLLTTGAFRLQINGTTYTSTALNSFVAWTCHKILAVVTRSSATTVGSVIFYVDGIIFGSAITITAGAPTTISNTSIAYHFGTSSTRTAGRVLHIYDFSRALSASESLDLAINGIAAGDKWGSETALYTSDFSAGVNGWTGQRATITGNMDAIGGQDDWLQIYASTDNNTHLGYVLGLSNKFFVRVLLTYYIPSTNTNVDGIQFNVGVGYSSVFSMLDAVTSVIVTLPNDGSGSLAVYLTKSGNRTFVGTGATSDSAYIKLVYLYSVGCTLALESESIQPSPGQWLDSSTNKLHAIQPTAGASLMRPFRTFEIHWTNTWSGTHEAQYIGGVNQSILPSNCYIDKIIGVVSGATIEDIIIGDGSDTDRWVAITTGLAAGTTSFTIANNISDGTNYKMVVDPDANFTGSIVWTIRGFIL